MKKDLLSERFAPTIKSLANYLRELGESIEAGGRSSSQWIWGGDPLPACQFEEALERIWQQSDGSDGRRAACLAASAIVLWNIIASPETELHERERLTWAIELGTIIRELEEFGDVGESGITLAEQANLGARFRRKGTELATRGRTRKSEVRNERIISDARKLLDVDRRTDSSEREGAGKPLRFANGKINASRLAAQILKVFHPDVGERAIRGIIGKAVHDGKLA